MIKKIKTWDLRIGMFIHDFNCRWIDHPFLKNNMKVSDEGVLRKITNAGIRELYIDTDKGLDVESITSREETDTIMYSTHENDETPFGENNVVSVGVELERAVNIKHEARETIKNVMNDIKFGGQIKTDNVLHVIDNITESIFRNQDALVSLVRIKKADEYTYMHSFSVCVLLVAFCKYLGIDKKLIRDVALGGLFHDIGKMAIPPEILNKPGRLSDDEFEVMKKHVEYGINILDETPGISDIAKQIVAQHHERLDGTGYPAGLKGPENSKFGQMAAIADIYDAMTSERCYRHRSQPTFVMKNLFKMSETSFTSDIIQQFIHCIGIYPVGTLIRLDNGMLGLVIDRGSNGLLHPVIRVIYNIKRERYVSPFDIDLSHTSDGMNYNIESYESPEKWDIKTEAYL